MVQICGLGSLHFVINGRASSPLLAQALRKMTEAIKLERNTLFSFKS